VTWVTLLLPPAAAWVAESYPVASAETRADGWLVVQLAVTSERWLERLLLRVGPEAQVLAPAELADVGRRAAQRLLARYR